MDIKDFEIGKIFYYHAGFQWLCTDKGSRTISAIFLDPKKDKIWFEGPPYNVEEKVFDEVEMKSCYTDTDEMIISRVENIEKSYHPNYDSKDFFKMMKEKRKSKPRTIYPREKMLTIDRVGQDGSIYHPYTAYKKDDKWIIKIFEIFEKTYSEMEEDEFVKLPRSNQEAMKKRHYELKNRIKNED